MAALLLLALLGVIAVLQYRWLGEVSTAERERLHASVQERSHELTTEIDRDLSRVYAAFQVSSAALDADPVAALSAAVARAEERADTGEAIKAIYLVEAGVPGGAVQRFDPAARILEHATWPEALAPLGTRLASARHPGLPGVAAPALLGESVDADAPALIVPVAMARLTLGSESTGNVMVRMTPPATWRAVVVWIDLERWRETVLAPLVESQFGDGTSSEFVVSVVSRRTQQSIYSTAPTELSPESADQAVDFFALRPDELEWDRPVEPSAGASAGPSDSPRVSITIVRRGLGGAAGEAPHMSGDGGWTLLVQARRGSLEAVVERSRLRNLGVSVGVLGVLGASIALLLLASARAERAARQQLEFVASVSHELRTPLAVIRSAGENLADGVVSGDQVAQYGELVRNEGRRLSEMVDRVLGFAGLSAGTLIGPMHPIEPAASVVAAVAALRPEAEARGVSLQVRMPVVAPRIKGDASALQSALQNAVGNAVKYGPEGSRVEIDVAATARTVRVTVADRGMGIDASDLPHVFEPFYRGRRAIESQVRGSGIGLSVVKQIVEAHGGEVQLAARDGGGVILTIELPALAPTGTTA